MIRKLKDLTESELKILYLIFELDKEESERKYPDLHKSNGIRIKTDEGTLYIDNDNNWGFLYSIDDNGSIGCMCKDDGSERNYHPNCGAIIKALFDMNVDLLNLKSWIK